MDLAVIKARLDAARSRSPLPVGDFIDRRELIEMVDWLVEEVEQLREENESFRAISGRSGIG